MSNSLTIIAHQTPGLVTFENYEEVKAAVQKKVDFYKSVVYSVDNLNDAKLCEAELKKDRDAITKVQKELKNAYSMPFSEVNDKLEELIEIINSEYKPLKSFIDEAEKEEKRAQIMAFAKEEAVKLGEVGQRVIDSPAFYNPKWDNKSIAPSKIYAEIVGIVSQAGKDLNSIQATAGKDVQALTAHYLQSLSMDSVKAFQESLQDDVSEEIGLIDDADEVRGYKILKISGTEGQMAMLMDQMELLGVEVEEIEDGMPQSMEELKEPLFDSFVAFDIETTGTNGVAHGDEEAKITEIGAVKVVNGEVVARFDELANPGRKILPRIARLTHITDAMVQDKPPVDEVIKMFADFCADSILVGHNIKSSDLHYITKAARKAGVKLENSYFDTYLLAKQFKEKMSWEKVNLGYLSEFYQIEHKDKHRAWSDAEANAEIYFRLKDLYENKE